MIQKNHVDLANSNVPRVLPVPKTWAQIFNMDEPDLDSVMRALGIDECIIAYDTIYDKRQELNIKAILGN